MPRFDSYTSDDIQLVIEELESAHTSGPFFKVQGEYIHPSDVVRFEGPENKATFYLRDGSVKTNKPFVEGESGDLLYRALRVIRRPPGNPSRGRCPANRIGVQGKVTNEFGDVIADIIPEKDVRIDLENELIFGIDDNNDDIYRYNLDGSNETAIYTSTDPIRDISLFKGENEVIAVRWDGSQNVISEITYSGGSPFDLYTGVPDMKSVQVDQREGILIGHEAGNNEIYKGDLQGNTFSTIASTNKNWNLSSIDTQRKEFYLLERNSYYGKVFDYSGNTKRVIGSPSSELSAQAFSYSERGDCLIVIDGNENILRLPRDGSDEIRDTYGTLPHSLSGEDSDVAFIPR